VPRLVHDRLTWLIYAQLGVWGFFLYGFGPVVPLLRDEQGTSAAVASLHSTGLAVGALLGGALFPLLARTLGRGNTLWMTLAGIAAGVLALVTFRSLPATLAATLLIGTVGTILVNGVNTVLADHHRRAAPAAISEANAVCAGMGFLAPLIIGLAVGAGAGWRPAMAAELGLIAAVVLVALFFRVRLPKRVPANAATGVRPGRLPRLYWIAWALLAMTGSIEVCLSLWVADVLRSHANMSPGGASAAVASIVGGMCLGRIAAGRIALRVPPAPLLLAALGVTAVGFVIFWLATAGWLAVIGLVIVGLGNATHYPLAISMALAAAGGQEDRASGYSSYSVAVGFGLAPVLLGWIADGVGTHLAFLLLPAFVAAAAVLTLRLRRALRALPPPPPVVAAATPLPAPPTPA
jgi:MFS family permease